MKAGDGWLLNWPWSSPALTRKRAAGNGDREPVGQDGDLTVIRGLSACVRQHGEPEWYRAGILSLSVSRSRGAGLLFFTENCAQQVCCLDKGESSPLDNQWRNEIGGNTVQTTRH